MSVVDQVMAAKKPQDAMLAIAAALDELLSREPAAADGWGEWGSSAEAIEERAAIIESVYSEEGGTLTEFKATSDEDKRAKRQRFADDVIAQNFGRADLENGEWHPDTTIIEAYVNAGPLWLYAYDRDFVMQLPQEMKVMLIEDVFEDDPEEGRGLGRDLLKDPSPGEVKPQRWADAAAVTD